MFFQMYSDNVKQKGQTDFEKRFAQTVGLIISKSRSAAQKLRRRLRSPAVLRDIRQSRKRYKIIYIYIIT